MYGYNNYQNSWHRLSALNTITVMDMCHHHTCTLLVIYQEFVIACSCMFAMDSCSDTSYCFNAHTSLYHAHTHTEVRAGGTASGAAVAGGVVGSLLGLVLLIVVVVIISMLVVSKRKEGM